MTGDPSERDRLRFELYEWRARALDAESARAELEALRTRRSWRIYTSFLKLAARILRSLRRREPSEGRPQHAPRHNRLPKTMLFVSGLSGDTRRYRCDHPAETLAAAGGSVDVELEANLDLPSVLDRYECFVLHRVLWSAAVERFVTEARKLGKSVLFDVDDLVFEPEAARFAVLEHMSEPDRIRFLDGLHRCRRTMEECDGILVGTDALATRAQEVLPRVAVSWNVVSSEMVELADAALRRRDGADSVRLSYFSGTPTHDRDFLEAADAVLLALAEYPHMRFRAVGRIELDERFERFRGRVERVPHQPWRRLPDLLATTGINLAPLERGNPFTECKSCVKYLEAGLLGVPTIASARADFARVIVDGENGLLADDAATWQRAIQTLVESPQLRHELGDAARTDVRANHTTASRPPEVVDTFLQLAPSLSASFAVPTAT